MTTDFSLILQRIVSIILTAIGVSFGSSAFGQNSDAALTAAQIIQRAIDSSGGDKNFEIVRNVETISQVVTSKGDTLYFSVKRMNFDKYFVSTLSLGYVNTTTVYNKGRAA